MVEDREAILSKIKKMLALTTSDSVEESANAADMAQAWLMRYHITEEELNEFSLEKNEQVVETIYPGKAGHNKVAWYNGLANVVAKANLCKMIVSGAGQIWIGKPTDIEVARYLFDMLAHDLERLCSVGWAVANAQQIGVSKWSKVHGKTWKNSFYHGAVQTIRERLNANLKQLEASDDAYTALIVSNDADIKDYVKDHYPFLVYNRRALNQHQTAFEAGKEAGRVIQFRQGVGAGGSHGPKLIRG